MPTKRYSTEQIVSKLRQAEVELSRGLRVPLVCKKLGISEQTYYRWRKEYGGLRLDQAKRLKELESCRGSCASFTEAKSAYVGPDYEKGTLPRLLFLSLSRFGLGGPRSGATDAGSGAPSGNHLRRRESAQRKTLVPHPRACLGPSMAIRRDSHTRERLAALRPCEQREVLHEQGTSVPG